MAQILNLSTLPSVTTAANPTAAQLALRITELSYHPTDPTPGEVTAISSAMADDFEYIELLNTGDTALNLAGARFTSGIDYTFPAGTTLAAGARFVVVANIPAFQLRHGTSTTAYGPFLGSLDNGGEKIQLVDPAGEVILDFSYDDDWYPATDGSGRTLVVRDAAPSHTGYGQPGHWAISGSATGSPGTGDASFGQSFIGWRWDHFSETEIKLPDGSENAALAGATADPDGDSLNNLGEYAFGHNARIPEGGVAETAGLVAVGADVFATITFARRTGALDLAYEVQFSGDLSQWGRSAIETDAPVPAGPGLEMVTVRDSVPWTGARRFARVKVILLP